MWATLPTDVLWRNTLAAIPLALVVAAACRWLPTRPATRHTLWLLVLLWLVIPPFLPTLDVPRPTSVERAVEEPIAVAAANGRSAPHAENRGIGGRTDLAADRGIARRASEAGTSDFAVGAVQEPSRERRPGAPRGSFKREKVQRASRTEPRSPQKLARATGSVGRLPEIPGSESISTGSTGSGHQPELAGAELAKYDRHDRQSAPAAPRGENKRSGMGYRKAGRPVIGQRGPEARPVKGVVTSNSKTEGSAPTQPVKTEAPVDWRAWIAGLVAVRDAVGALPRIPTSVWVTGMVLLVLVQTARVWRFRRRIRSAGAAPQSVMEMVRTTARKLGLRRCPQAFMTSQRISPVICCGRRPRMLLPTELWSQLDDDGRQAVVCHELAHLRRRDHWVRWAEIVIGALYWWNPLVWWVRRRLHIEAESSCDAWVTWLLPHGRRAYAQALLISKQFVDQNSSSMPAVGIGVITGRAEHFGRRLTMVMTQQMRPRLSVSGISLALVLAVAGWAAVPARSCPPAANQAKDAPAAKAGCDQKCGEQCQCGKAPTVNAQTTFERHMTGKQGGTGAYQYVLAGDPNDLEKRLAELEAKLERLGDQLDRMADKLGEPREVRVPRTPRAPRAPRAPRTPLVITETRVFEDEGEIVIRAYELPEGKLEALTALMVRPDVPILVSPKEDRLEVHAISPHHEVFGDFVAMITPETTPDLYERSEGEGVLTRTYRLPEGKLEALTTLMIRPDVPILVSPHDDRLDVQAGPEQQGIFERFVTIIHPEKLAPPPPAARPLPAPHPMPAPRIVEEKGETVVRAYRLPEGKLDALTALMIRPDVPILVSPTDDQLEVHATPYQHGAFGQFITMIDSEEDWKAYHLSPGKLEALTELMVRSDVPIYVQPMEDQLRVRGTGLEQDVFETFVDMIDPGQTHPGISRFSDDHSSLATQLKMEIKRKTKAVKEKAKKIAQKQKQQQKQLKAEAKAKAKKIAKKLKEYKKHQEHQKYQDCDEQKEHQDCPKKRMKIKHRSGEHTFKEAREEYVEELIEERIQGALESLASLADDEQVAKLTEMAHKIAAEAAQKDWKDQGRSLETQAKAIEKQAQAFETQARELEKQAVQIEQQAQNIERMADALTDQADELSAKAEVVEEGERDALLAQANAMFEEANTLISKANALVEQAGGFERVAVGLEEKAGAMDNWAEALRNALEEAKALSTTAE